MLNIKNIRLIIFKYHNFEKEKNTFRIEIQTFWIEITLCEYKSALLELGSSKQTHYFDVSNFFIWCVPFYVLVF